MVSHHTCLTILLIVFLTRSSNTVPKKVVYFCLPFTGSHSLQIRTQITRLCNAAYPHINIRFVFCSHKHISSFFPFKDKVPKFLRSGVVYLFKCQCCSASYVGQTMRHLHTSILEHLGLTPITGQPSSSPVMSSIFSHLNTTVNKSRESFVAKLG